MSGPAWQATLTAAANSVSTTATYASVANSIASAIALAKAEGKNFIYVSYIPPAVVAYLRKIDTFTVIDPILGEWKITW